MKANEPLTRPNRLSALLPTENSSAFLTRNFSVSVGETPKEVVAATGWIQPREKGNFDFASFFTTAFGDERARARANWLHREVSFYPVSS